MFYFQAKPTITVGTKKVTTTEDKKKLQKEKFNSIFVQSHRMFSFFSNCARCWYCAVCWALFFLLVVAKPGVSRQEMLLPKVCLRFFCFHTRTIQLLLLWTETKKSGSSPKTAFTSTHSKSEWLGQGMVKKVGWSRSCQCQTHKRTPIQHIESKNTI